MSDCGEWFPLPDEDTTAGAGVSESPERLDSVMPKDPATGAITSHALRVTLSAFIDLMSRHGVPMTVLAITSDPSDALRLLGEKGLLLIGSAMARWLRQETRIHDVVGRSEVVGEQGAPVFLMICPLMTETVAAQFAERMRRSMTMSAVDEGSEWLTISVGIAALSLDTHTPDALILRAEEALASAQRRGGGRVWSHSDSVRRIIERDGHEPRQE